MSHRLRKIGICFCAGVLSAMSCGPLFGVDRDLRIDQLHHTAWTLENAGIGGIKQVVQTSDGFLWLKTATGHLLRFDGVRFETIETALAGTIPGGEHRWDDIYSIVAARNGGIWIGHGVPRLDLVKNGKTLTFTPQDGLPKAPIDRLTVDRDDVLWIATAQGLSRLQGSHFTSIGSDWGYSGGTPTAMLADNDGTLWVMSHDGRLFFLNRGARTFRINKSGSDTGGYDSFLAQAPDGKIWVSSHTGLRRVLTGSKDQPGTNPTVLDPHLGETTILFDREGTLWIQLPTGLFRIQNPEQLIPWRSKSDGKIALKAAAPMKIANSFSGPYTPKQGLSSDIILDIFEDREGNIWTGTGAGLDRFRNNSFIKLPLPPTREEQFALAPGDHGAVWAANWDSPLFEISDQLQAARLSINENISALYRDPAGAICGGDGRQYHLAFVR